MKRINETLLELMVGILAFAAVCQVSFVWLVERRLWYSLGLWAGAAIAVFCAVHMYRSLDTALELGADAPKLLSRKSMQRYLMIVLLLGIMMVTEIANPLSAFLGLMGLKVAAYLQPFTHKWIHRNKIEEN
ncbi:MAG: hypothetical protein J6B10_03270 [Lachnospiraceae bacterium]|nr:hypothetical protein [Lachnospiraceae bacterium]